MLSIHITTHGHSNDHCHELIIYSISCLVITKIKLLKKPYVLYNMMIHVDHEEV